MLHERVTVIMDDQLTPIPGLPLLSSAASKCSSFLLETHVIAESRDDLGWCWHNTHVAVCTSGPSLIDISGGAGHGRFLANDGDIFIIPKGCGLTNIHHSGGNFHFAVVEIDYARLECLFHEQTLSIDSRLTPQLCIPETRIAALINSMRAEVEAGCPSDPLYGESLSLALTAYVCSHYSVHTQDTQAINHRFSHVQSQRLLEFVHAHLGGDFSLVELARIVHLSPRHFSRLFRNTFGMSPHRYVVSERIRQAQQLLGASQLSIVEIAARTGFASQSHFTDVFRRAIGVSPKRYKQVH
jgi:AraC family transcriptional regulator